MKVVGVLAGLFVLFVVPWAIYGAMWLGGFRPDPVQVRPTYSAPRYTPVPVVPVQPAPTQQSTEDAPVDVDVDVPGHEDDDHKSRFCSRHWYC